ncbi:MAG: IMP dehydrogenase [Planctomycetes bacterium]|nr:IMP dehydrogenase [Planctomycetota bacterium]
MDDKIVGFGITFDDVLLVPALSDVVPKDVVTQTQFTRTVSINIPITSAAMDTVTEAGLAIALAQEGGIGIIHRNLPIDAQVREVDKVKRSANGIILDPITLPPNETIGTLRRLMEENRIGGVPIVEEKNRLVGILTNRDLRFHRNPQTRIAEVMTKENLVTAPFGTTLEEAKEILHRHKVEKLLLTEGRDRTLRGLITIKDINKMEAFPKASRDEHGRLRVGAAVGVRDYERVHGMIAAGVDVVVVDTAHGHSTNVIETVKEIKKRHDISVVAGNVATAAGTHDLIAAGVDAVKVGIGPGAVCTTRIVAGIGVPQITAVWECAREANKSNIPIIADGGIRYSGDIVKAIAAGASSVMIGSLFAGVEESPGEMIIFKGRSFKSFRGMGSTGAMMAGSKDRYAQSEVTDREKLVPEGVEGRVPYKGSLSAYVYQLVGGLRAAMGYCGAHDIDHLRKNSRFLRVSHAGQIESHPHDMIITKEAPNYRVESPGLDS